MQYWYNVLTQAVEENDSPDRDRLENLMGPYPSREEAQAALETAAARTAFWDEEDERRRELDEEWGQTPGQVLGFGAEADDSPQDGSGAGR